MIPLNLSGLVGNVTNVCSMLSRPRTFPAEPPLELTAPEDLVDELALALRSRDREEAR